MWLVPVVPYFIDAGAKATHLGWTAFWSLGVVVWIGWGIVAFSKVGTRFVRAIWMGSAFFHGSVLAILLIPLAATWAAYQGRVSILWLIPAWWSIATLASLFAYGVLKIDEAERQ